MMSQTVLRCWLLIVALLTVATHQQVFLSCFDESVECNAWAAAGSCSRNSRVRQTCRKACGLCESSPTVPPTMTSPSRPIAVVAPATECRDLHSQCGYWASVNECTRNVGYMEVNCRQSCGLCDSSSVAIPADDNFGTELLAKSKIDEWDKLLSSAPLASAKLVDKLIQTNAALAQAIPQTPNQALIRRKINDHMGMVAYWSRAIRSLEHTQRSVSKNIKSGAATVYDGIADASKVVGDGITSEIERLLPDLLKGIRQAVEEARQAITSLVANQKQVLLSSGDSDLNGRWNVILNYYEQLQHMVVNVWEPLVKDFDVQMGAVLSNQRIPATLWNSLVKAAQASVVVGNMAEVYCCYTSLNHIIPNLVLGEQLIDVDWNRPVRKVLKPQDATAAIIAHIAGVKQTLASTLNNMAKQHSQAAGGGQPARSAAAAAPVISDDLVDELMATPSQLDKDLTADFDQDTSAEDAPAVEETPAVAAQEEEQSPSPPEDDDFDW